MESRQITEYKIYILALSDVRGNVDNLIAVAVFDDREKLRNFIEGQREDWLDDEGGEDFFGKAHIYHKAFKKGSILEWYNAPSSLDSLDNYGGVKESWVSYYPQPSEFTVPFNPVGI